jgi:hypothetical protein
VAPRRCGPNARNQPPRPISRKPSPTPGQRWFAHHYRPLQGDELTFVLTRHWRRLGLALDDADFSDTQAIAAVARITVGTPGCCPGYSCLMGPDATAVNKRTNIGFA